MSTRFQLIMSKYHFILKYIKIKLQYIELVMSLTRQQIDEIKSVYILNKSFTYNLSQHSNQFLWISLIITFDIL